MFRYGMNPNLLVPIVLFGFIPLAVILFTLLSARRAVASVVVIGWLFLPPGMTYSFPGVPDYSKYVAVGLGALMGAVIFDSRRVFAFRPAWYDIPAIVLAIVPFFSSVTNGLGAYDGISQVFGMTSAWIVPYFLARIYFSDLAGIRDLAFIMLIGGLVYVPLCWYEIRFSPDLNRAIYGYYQNDFGQTRRYGGWRPTVFMDHGLAVGLWMCTSTLVGVLLWQSGWPRRVIGLPIAIVTIVLGLTALFVKSFGALALLALGLITGMIARYLRAPWVLIVLVMIPIGYVFLRATGLWSGQELISLATAIGGDERGGSLMVRINNETTHVAKALQQPIFGWGTYGRNRVTIQETGSRSITDALWLIVIGQRGIVGLLALMAMILMPVVLFVTRWGRAGLTHPWLAPGAALCIVLIMFLCDSLFNAFLNPVYLMAAGALMGLRPDARTVAVMHQQTAQWEQAMRARKNASQPARSDSHRAARPA